MLNQDSNEYNKIIHDVIFIFKDITQISLEPTREAAAIIHFSREHKFANYEFRLIIEHHWKNPFERQYLDKPGNANLRTIFNKSREARILDLVRDLSRIAQAKEKHEIKQSELQSEIKINRIRCQCGDVLEQKYIKIPCDDTPRKYKWVEAYVNEIERHIHSNGEIPIESAQLAPTCTI